MTRTQRAVRAALRNQQEAERLTASATRAEEAGRPDLARGLRDQAARYESTATEWLRIAAAEAEARVEHRECCAVPLEEPCDHDCGCSDCENDRALEEDADAYRGNCS